MPVEAISSTRHVVKIVGIEMDDQGCSCKEHINCKTVLKDDVVVCAFGVMVEGQEERDSDWCSVGG